MEKKKIWKTFWGAISVWCFLGCVVCLFIFVCVVVVCGRMARQTHWWLGCFVPWILVRNCAGCPVTRTADKPDKNRPGCLVFATLMKIEQLIKSWIHSSFRHLIWSNLFHLEMQSLNHLLHLPWTNVYSFSSPIVSQGISHLDNLLSCWVSSFSVHNPATSLTSPPWKVWLHDLGVLIVEDYGPSNMKPVDEASIGMVRLWGNGLKRWEAGMWEAESCQQRVLSHGKQTELIWSVFYQHARASNPCQRQKPTLGRFWGKERI